MMVKKATSNKCSYAVGIFDFCGICFMISLKSNSEEPNAVLGNFLSWTYSGDDVISKVSLFISLYNFFEYIKYILIFTKI